MVLLFLICKMFGCTLSWWWMILFMVLDELSAWYGGYTRKGTLADIFRFIRRKVK